MKCRNFKDWIDEDGIRHRDIVWFGSYGLKEDGTAKRYEESDSKFVSHSNYSDKQHGLTNSLTQNLSVLKGELWYNVKFGLPLLDKQKSKAVLDAYVISTIFNNTEVLTLKKMSSSVTNHGYLCSFVVETSYGELTID